MSPRRKNPVLQRVPLQGQGQGTPPTSQQGHGDEHDIEMEDVGNASNPPQGTATQTNPPPEVMEDDLKGKDDVIVEDEQIIIEGGGVTPITPADD